MPLALREARLRVLICTGLLEHSLILRFIDSGYGEDVLLSIVLHAKHHSLPCESYSEEEIERQERERD